MIVTETNRLVTAQGKNKLGLLDYQKLLVARLEQTTAFWRLHRPWEPPEDQGRILQVDW